MRRRETLRRLGFVSLLGCSRARGDAMRRAVVILAVSIAGVGIFTGGLAWLLTDPRPPAGAGRGERLYYAYCVECHGRDGRGSWRAALFLLRPGNLADAGRMATHSDQYLFDIVKHGGAPLGRPGMPSFGYHMSDDDIRTLVVHLRTLGRP
jgi:mono/diheme cytochrome c family protein